MHKKIFIPLVILLLLFSIPAFAAVPKTINFQGRLIVNGTAHAAGTDTVTFKIYDTLTGASSGTFTTWSETDTNVIFDSNGVFSVKLGNQNGASTTSTLNIPFDRPLYVEMTYNGTALSPRQSLSPVPFAFYALTAESVVGAGSTITDTITPSGDLIGYVGSKNKRFSEMHAQNFYGTVSVGPDLAENYIVNEQAEAGDVVVIDKNKELKLCSKTNDPAVAGVVSTAPGVILNEALKTGKAIGLVGCVPTKVDATMYPVQAGDLLTTSATPGYAMKAVDPKPGTILGKALEALPSGKGKIMVLVSLQ